MGLSLTLKAPILLVINNGLFKKNGGTMKVVVIGAHPDDYEIGAGMRLLHHVEMGDEVIGVICSAGEMGGERETRIKEAILSAEFIGMKGLYILSFPDTRFPEVAAMKDSLEDVIIKEEPSVVYTHFPGDRHQDHRATAQASAIACRSTASILTYQSPSTDVASFQPHLFQVGLEEDFIKKQEAIEIYQSQIERSLGVNLEQIKLDARYYGSCINRYSREQIYAEPFCANHFVLNCREMNSAQSYGRTSTKSSTLSRFL